MVDPIVTVREIQVESREHHLEIFVAIVDFQQLYYRNERKELFTAMTELGINKN